MVNAIIVGDVHITDPSRVPRYRTKNYTFEILDKLKFCVAKANEYQVPLVQAGDLFHHKSALKNSHWLVQQVHHVLRECDKEVFLLFGNHDEEGDRLDNIDKQPLGSLIRMDKMNPLMGDNDKLPGIMGVPYLNQFSGIYWQEALWEWLSEFGENAELLVTHAPIFPPGQAPNNWFSIEPRFWANVACGIRATYYGHIHECHGSYEVDDMTFCNQGALSRGSLHEASISRKPAITLWDSDTFSFKRIEVPHKPAEEVFLFSEAEQVKENKASAQDFAAAFATAQVHGLTRDDFLGTLKAKVSGPKVYEIIEQAVEESE